MSYKKHYPKILTLSPIHLRISEALVHLRDSKLPNLSVALVITRLCFSTYPLGNYELFLLLSAQPNNATFI